MLNTLGLKNTFFTLFTLLCTAVLHGQPMLDTLYEVSPNEVVVQREKLFNAGSHSWKPDSNMLLQYNSHTLGELLGEQSGMFVRTFTPGTLATPIMRGTYGIYTAVVWNGFNLQSPMNQLVDLNLIPVFFIDAAEVGYGSNSALYGSGAVGGTIAIGQTGREQNGLHGKLLAGAGSFGTYQQGVKLSYKNNRYTGRVRYFNHIAQNNYQYSNTAKAGRPTETLTNAQWWNNGQMIENFFIIKKNITASLHGWHTQAYRAVAPLMIQNRSVAYQKDDVWRLVGDVKYRGIKAEAVVRFTYFDERIRYSDVLLTPPLINDNRAFGLVLEGEYRYRINNRHDVSIGLNNSNYKSTAINYGTPPPVQYRNAVFASYRYRNTGNRFVASATLRQEVVSLRNTTPQPLVGIKYPGKLKMLPFIPSLGADWNFYRPLWLQAKVSRLYRYPHFNDLYWIPGGNPNLLPESGFSSEINLLYKNRFKKRLTINASVGGYYNLISNWILWQVGQGGIWTPSNIQQVAARGLETMAEANYIISVRSYVQADARYSYTLSTNEKKKTDFDDSYKKQLIYVPHHMAAANITAGYKQTYIRINGQYTGKQYTSADNVLWLPGFYTLNVFAGGRLPAGKTSFDVSVQARNVLNRRYSAVEWLPMPGRNYLATLTFNF